jgi:ribosomal protein S18 acetylase RimI-like enzyme
VADVEIREARPEEYNRVGELLVDAYRTLGDSGDQFYESMLGDVAGRARESIVLVALADGSIVGSGTYVPPGGELAEVDDRDAATIRMVGVSPDARGRGIGAVLVEACIARARTDGALRVRLDTRTSMAAAQRLYERLGFRRDPRHNWRPVPGIELLAYVLELSD